MTMTWLTSLFTKPEAEAIRDALIAICEAGALTVCGICGEPSTADVCKGCA